MRRSMQADPPRRWSWRRVVQSSLAIHRCGMFGSCAWNEIGLSWAAYALFSLNDATFFGLPCPASTAVFAVKPAGAEPPEAMLGDSCTGKCGAFRRLWGRSTPHLPPRTGGVRVRPSPLQWGVGGTRFDSRFVEFLLVASDSLRANRSNVSKQRCKLIVIVVS